MKIKKGRDTKWQKPRAERSRARPRRVRWATTPRGSPSSLTPPSPPSAMAGSAPLSRGHLSHGHLTRRQAARPPRGSTQRERLQCTPGDTRVQEHRPLCTRLGTRAYPVGGRRVGGRAQCRPGTGAAAALLLTLNKLVTRALNSWGLPTA